MRSKFLTLNQRDFLKGLLIAVLTAVLSAIYNILSAGGAITFRSVLLPGILALISYLLKNLFTNSKGEIATKEL